jgi:hypothetical protein
MISTMCFFAAPPRPSRAAIQVLSDTVHSKELSIRLDLSQLSERNGQLRKIALVVAEADENGELEEEEGEEAKKDGGLTTRRQFSIEDNENGTVSKWEKIWGKYEWI